MDGLILIRKKWHHMGDFSGSDLLFEEISKSLPSYDLFVNEIRVPSKSVFRMILEKLQIVSRLNLWSLQLSSINGIKEIYALQMAIEKLDKGSRMALFVSCAEEQLTKRVGSLIPEIKKRIYVLLHQPPAWYEKESGFVNHLNGLGGVFVFSNRMKDHLNVMIDSPVFSIRHGVDLEFFNPGLNQSNRNMNSIICVGNWFRDFELLSKCWSRLHKFDQNLKLTLISSNEALKNEWFQSLIRLPNVCHKTGLDSNELLETYQTACLHFLPLTDGVANNALVESLATACPLLVTNAGSTTEYLPTNHFGLSNIGDVDDHFQKAIALLTDSRLRNEMAFEQRQFALNNLSWSNISQQVISTLS